MDKDSAMRKFELTLNEAINKIEHRSRTIEEYGQSYEARESTYLRYTLAEGIQRRTYTPWDFRDEENDVAFGMTKRWAFLDATMVAPPEDMEDFKQGLISHGALLFAAGLSSHPDDPSPTDDYRIRGIVKPKFNNNILFWETTQQLLGEHEAVRQCVEKLLEKGLVNDDSKVFGNNSSVPVASVSEIVKDWRSGA